MTLVTAQLSVAVTVKITLLAQTPGAALTVISGGQVICGDWLSITMTVKLHVLALPLLSRAVLVTVVVPTGKAKPLNGALVKLVTAQLSMAVTLKVRLVVQFPDARLALRLDGQLITGGVMS